MQRHRVLRASLLLVSLLGPAASATTLKSADREALKRVLSEVAARSPLQASRVGVQVVSLEDGSVLFSRGENELLNPASNVKLVTAAAALARLGPEYRFETEFLVDPSATAERTRALYVRGKGDPSLTTERLYGIVSELLHLGLREVGDLVVDDSFFDAERLAPGFEQETTDRAYTAPTGALSLNANAVGIYVRASGLGKKTAVEVEPASEYFTVVNSAMATASRARRVTISSEPAGDHQRIVVRGTVPPTGEWAVWKRIDNPPLYFGDTLRRLLEQRGIRVRGKVKLGHVADKARLLFAAQSDTFDLVLKRMNKHSSNFVAEQLLKALGAEVKGAPGTTAKGVQAAEEFLEREVGLPRGSYVLKNGSGLNDTNRFSAAQMVKLLRTMWDRFPLAPEYLSSVGIAGKDGTLRWRFEGSDAVGRLRAKTGTLENVSALSGYVQCLGGERFAFSVMVNDYPGRSGAVVQAIDALGAAIAASGGSQGPDRAVAELTGPPSQLASSEEAKARIRTYLALGKQGDRRNVAFLRTAWRNEKDPAVRAVVADAIHQSSPEDDVGVRALLDSFAASDEVYGRLRQIARELKMEVPGLSSLVSLAAEGNPEALQRLFDFNRAARADPSAQAELAAALAEIGRTAPDELLLALRGSPPPERDAAVTALARGLSKAGDPDHPLWPAVHKLMASVDRETAAFARALESSLSLAIAALKAPPSPGPAAPTAVVPRPGAAPEQRPGG